MRVLRRAGGDESFDDIVRQQVNDLRGFVVGADDGFRAVIKRPHVAVAHGVLVGGEEQLVRARLGAVVIAPANRRAVVRQRLSCSVRIRQPMNTLPLKMVYSIIEVEASLLV